MLERVGVCALLQLKPVADLMQDEIFLVKCLGAILSPLRRVVVLCGGHVQDVQQEADILKKVLMTITDHGIGIEKAEYGCHVMLHADDRVASCYADAGAWTL